MELAYLFTFPMKPSLTLIVLTYNEEQNVRRALESVRGVVEQIIIVDSFSTDQTLSICEEFGADIYQRAFDNQAKQFNWALEHVTIRGEWILRLDADEYLTGALADEIRKKLAAVSEVVTGFYMRRRVMFMGRWMKHGAYYPMWFLRLFRRGKGRYEEITEEHIVLTEGKAMRLEHDFIDFNRKGLTFWVDKHNHWSMGEMIDTMALMGRGRLADGTVTPKLSGTQEQRTRWLKTNIYAKAPLLLRAFLYFLYRYVIRLGFLDGKEGLIFHFLQGCWYRFLVDAKVYEASRLGLQFAMTKREYTGSKPWEDSPVTTEPKPRLSSGSIDGMSLPARPKVESAPSRTASQETDSRQRTEE